MRRYIENQSVCRRVQLLSYFDPAIVSSLSRRDPTLCCGNCKMLPCLKLLNSLNILCLPRKHNKHCVTSLIGASVEQTLCTESHLPHHTMGITEQTL